jgi:hypothetical protein
MSYLVSREETCPVCNPQWLSCHGISANDDADFTRGTLSFMCLFCHVPTGPDEMQLLYALAGAQGKEMEIIQHIARISKTHTSKSHIATIMCLLRESKWPHETG